MDMKLTTLILVLTVTGCAAYPMLIPPSPAHCRANGVYIPDGSPVKGEILEINIAGPDVVRAKCQRPFSSVSGCALAVAPGQYVIWTIDDYSVRTHEECAALYDLPQHRHTK
jgi:hypothetical protein